MYWFIKKNSLNVVNMETVSMKACGGLLQMQDKANENILW